MSEPRADRRSTHETPESQEAKPQPAALALSVLRKVCAPDAREEAEGDLMEAFNRWMESRGPRFARRRAWREVTLLAGASSPRKQFLVAGMTAKGVRAALEAL